MDNVIEKTVSNLIGGQFPEFYLEDGPVFVEFVRAYYKWMETNNQTLYHTRRLMEYKDIDQTADEFLVYFKEKYLRNIQLDTVQNTRQLLKHSLDLYRSKGTERSLELLFKVAFGVSPSVYYPGDDLFKTSDGVWKVPNYFEVSINNDNILLNNRQIRGLKSKATAFVEAVVRRNNGGILSDILYVTDIKGRFVQGERLLAANVNYHPTILGSLVKLEIDTNGIGMGFAIGQETAIHSNTGINAKGFVDGLTNTSGQLKFQIIDGGFGFLANTPVQISDVNLTLPLSAANLVIGETIYQSLATLNYVNANGYFHASNTISAYYANGSLKATALVISTVESNTTAGSLFVEQISGNISANAIYSTGNTVGANLSVISGFVDLTASGTVLDFTTGPSSIKVGVYNSVNAYYPNVYINTTNSLINANLIATSNGHGGGFSISNNLLYPDTVSLNSDSLLTYANTALNAATYAFPQFPTANSNTALAVALAYSNLTFGKIQVLTNIHPGAGYTDRPFIKIVEPRSGVLGKHEVLLNIANVSSTFAVGEVVEQATTNARLLVISANTSVIRGQYLTVVNDFNTLYSIVGDTSTATANVTYVVDDPVTALMGNNAVISTDLASGNNAATSIRVSDSGFNFFDGQTVYIDIGDYEYEATAKTDALGAGSGYYAKEGGFPSDRKKIFDGEYYQNFSYDIRASIPLDKYHKLLKDVVHMSGYAMFGTLVHERIIETEPLTVQKVITIQ